MTGSVLEQEIRRRMSGLGARFQAHDRGVVIGFVFSLLPIFPVVFVGLGLGLFHRAMHRAGKVSSYDYGLARRGLLLATINCVLSLLIVWAVLHMASGFEWGRLGGVVGDRLRDFFNFLWGRVTPTSNRTGVVI